MKRRFMLWALLCGLCASERAFAQEPQGEGAPAAEGEEDKPSDFEARAKRPRLGMQPGAPQNQSVAPAQPYGIESQRADDWVLNFHGFVQVPVSIGFAKRRNPIEGQSSLVLHNPPDIPQDIREFEYTGVIPTQWVQLDFTYGSTLMQGTLILAARRVGVG
jgi:hypothetical protein